MKFIAIILYIFFSFLCVNLLAQKKKLDTIPKISIYLETGIIPVKSQNTSTQICYQGQLALIYNIKRKIQIGIFGQTLLYTGNYDIANIDNKIIELSSLEYNTCGITTCYKFQFNKIILNPKLDYGYNFFLAKSLDFPTDKNEFLDYRYLSLNAKLYLGYAISDGLTLGINSGYTKQILALKGRFIDEFNPNTFHFGLITIIHIQ